MASAQPLYTCKSCRAYCCSYPVIQARPRDRIVLANFLGISEKQFFTKYTTSEEQGRGRVRAMRHTPDKLIGSTSCVFLNKKTRCCKVYKARPQICRDHPGDSIRCEWYDRLTIENIAAKGRKVYRLALMPDSIDGDRPQYESENLGELLDSYAHGNGAWPAAPRTRRKRAGKKIRNR